MSLELTYSRKNIVRTVAIGFVLGALVLSTGWIVLLLGMALAGVEPFNFRNTLPSLLWVPVVLLFMGIALGWVVRLGLGVYSYWQYRHNEKSVAQAELSQALQPGEKQ